MKPFIEFPNLGLKFDFSGDNLQLGKLTFGLNSIYVSIFYLVAFVTVIVFTLLKCEKYGVIKDDLLNILILGTFFSGICSVFYYILFPWDGKGSYLFSIIRMWEMINISALIAIFIFTKIKKRSFLKYADFILPYIMLGQAVGMLGSFNSADSFGSQTNLPWGLTGSNIVEFLKKLKSTNEFAGDPFSSLLHPIYMYEAILCIIGFVFLMLYKKHAKADGEVFCLYFIYLGFSRIIIEAFRMNGITILDTPIRLAQILSIVVIIFGFTLLSDFRRNKKIKIFNSADITDNKDIAVKKETVVEDTPLSRLVSQMKEEESRNYSGENSDTPDKEE